MKQRALLAKTLVHEPSVLLLDEPAANLDPKARIDLRNLLRRLASSGKTVLVSSHVLTELEDLCDAIGIMNQGNMALSGSLGEVTASASSSKVILLELAEPFPNLENLLSESPSVSQVEARDEAARIFEITHLGDKSEAAALLTTLTGAGAKVCGFHPKQSKVEDLFLEIEAKGTSKETGL
jgi:ABC-2 type transport system ATP-binding protein